MTTHKAVTDGNGKFIGQIDRSSPLGWVGPARAACYPTVVAALAVAKQFDGIVVNAPVWDSATSSYVVPS